MTKRPVLDKHLDSKTFREFYYLKEELIDFCRKYRLPVYGGKIEITDRIAYFLDTVLLRNYLVPSSPPPKIRSNIALLFFIICPRAFL